MIRLYPSLLPIPPNRFIPFCNHYFLKFLFIDSVARLFPSFRTEGLPTANNAKYCIINICGLYLSLIVPYEIILISDNEWNSSKCYAIIPMPDNIMIPRLSPWSEVIIITVLSRTFSFASLS